MLEVKDLAVSYGRHRALQGVSVKVDKGEICVILGGNGAGKSTLLKAIAGMARAEPGGEVTMNGERITAMKPHRIVERGIALVPEGRGIFGDLTVAENLQLGAFAGRARRDEAARLAQIYELFPRLAERRKQVARTMSGGEQQMVAIGRALMSRPEILMLDEPSLGLSPLLTQELFRSLKAIAATGVGVLLVEQNAKQSLRIAERGYLIENGHVTGEASAEALMKNPAVVNAYLGGAAGVRAGRPRVALPPPMRLPLDAGAIGGLIADLASRAGRIQAAFVRSLRQEAALPSAFVGRYDPKAAGDPWAAVEPEAVQLSGAPAKVSEEAKRVGDLAETLARRASERLAAHVRTTRLSAARPSAFANAANVGMSLPPRPQSTPATAPAIGQPDRPSGLNGSYALIGHNSGGIVLDAETAEPTTPAESGGLSIAALAAHAASIHAAHVAERRRKLRAFVVPAASVKAGKHHSKNSAKKKRKKHKEA